MRKVFLLFIFLIFSTESKSFFNESDIKSFVSKGTLKITSIDNQTFRISGKSYIDTTYCGIKFLDKSGKQVEVIKFDLKVNKNELFDKIVKYPNTGLVWEKANAGDLVFCNAKDDAGNYFRKQFGWGLFAGSLLLIIAIGISGYNTFFKPKKKFK